MNVPRVPSSVEIEADRNALLREGDEHADRARS